MFGFTDPWVLFEKLQTFNADTCIQRLVWQIRAEKSLISE